MNGWMQQLRILIFGKLILLHMKMDIFKKFKRLMMDFKNNKYHKNQLKRRCVTTLVLGLMLELGMVLIRKELLLHFATKSFIVVKGSRKCFYRTLQLIRCFSPWKLLLMIKWIQ